MRLARIIFCVCQMLLLSPLAARAEQPESIYWGEARDEKGRIRYAEKHIVDSLDGKTLRSLTVYLDPEGRRIAELESDYTLSLALPTYVFKDFRRNYEEGLRYRQGRYYIFNRDASKGDQEKLLEDSANVFSCQGWHYYVIHHLDRIEKGESFALKLIFPAKLRAYPFKIEKVRSEGRILHIRVRFAYWMLSWIVPHLDLVYDLTERNLVQYRGVSNIFDEQQNLQNVVITYSDTPPAWLEPFL